MKPAAALMIVTMALGAPVCAEAPQSAPATGPASAPASSDAQEISDLVNDLHKKLIALGEKVGGLSAAQVAKVEVIEVFITEDIKDSPEMLDRPKDVQAHAFKQFREILDDAQKKKFDAIIETQKPKTQ